MKKHRQIPSLYGWQEECLDSFEQNRFRGIVNVVTGAGKTRLALEAIRLLKEYFRDLLAVRILVPTIPLMRQWRQDLSAYGAVFEDSFYLRPGLYYGEHKDPTDAGLLIYVINSARYRLSSDVLSLLDEGKYVLIIADECHHCASPENRKCFDFYLAAGRNNADTASVRERVFTLGLSATPFRPDSRSFLEMALGPEIYRYQFPAARAEEVISNFAVAQVALSFTSQERAEYARLTDRLRRLYALLVRIMPEIVGMPQEQLLTYLSRSLQKKSAQAGRDKAAAPRAPSDPSDFSDPVNAYVTPASHARPDPSDFSDPVNAYITTASHARPDSSDFSDPANAYITLAYRRRKLTLLAQSRLSCACALIRSLPDDQQIIIFSERIIQAEELTRKLEQIPGARPRVYHSGLTSTLRREILSQFRDHTIRVLVTCRALDEGIDVPAASIGIFLSGSSVLRQRIQRLGRILRRTEESPLAVMYYFYIRESSEESGYLPARLLTDTAVLRMTYTAPDDAFTHARYEDAAAALLFGRDALYPPDSPQQQELRSCLMEGLPRTDWLLHEDVLDEKIRSAASQHERNYYTAMKHLKACDGSPGGMQCF